MLSAGPVFGKILSRRAQSGWLSSRAIIPTPALLTASMIRSGSCHSKAFFFVFSMFRHSKRCLIQAKPASLASFRSRSVVSGWPHRKTDTAGWAAATLPSRTSWTVGDATTIVGVGAAFGSGLAFAAGLGAAVFDGLVGGGPLVQGGSTKLLMISSESRV